MVHTSSAGSQALQITGLWAVGLERSQRFRTYVIYVLSNAAPRMPWAILFEKPAHTFLCENGQSEMNLQ